MSLMKFRLKILQKLAQQTGAAAAPAAPTSSTTTTDANTPATTNNPATPPAPAIRASDIYPTVRIGFDPGRVVVIDSLVGILNTASQIATAGQYNLQVLRNLNFQFDPSSFTSPDQKNLMIFFQKVWKTLLNGGVAFTAPMPAATLNTDVQFLLQSPELANLSQMNPSGAISQKIPGNFKDDIRNLIARLQPTVPTRRA
jgi:hypothetical protein